MLRLYDELVYIIFCYYVFFWLELLTYIKIPCFLTISASRSILLVFPLMTTLALLITQIFMFSPITKFKFQ